MANRSLKDEDIIQALNNATRVIARRYPLPEIIFKRIADAIFDKLRERGNSSRPTPSGISLQKLSEEDTKKIASTLIIRDKKSPETLLHWTILNDFIEQLINLQIIDRQSKYFNVPQQIKRDLLTYVEKCSLENILKVSTLSESLLSLNTALVFSSKDEEEIEYVCSFIASAAIFGKVLTPDFYLKLLKIQQRDFSLDPVSINLPLKGCENQENGAFYRFFLPCPASIYLLRYILFIQGNRKDFGINIIDKPDAFIFAHFLPKLKEFPKIFNRWLAGKFEALGLKENNNMTLKAFRGAVVDLSLSEFHSDSPPLPGYPPFLLATQSGKIRSDSCVSSHFMLDPDQPGQPDYTFVRRSVKRIGEKRATDSSLSRAFKTIYAFLKPLKKETTVNERKVMAENMRSTVLTLKDSLPSGAFENLRLAIEFVCRLLVIKKDNSKSKIRRQSIAVRYLILDLPDNISIHDLPNGVINAAVTRIAEPYSSDFIQTGCQAFMDFLHLYLGVKLPVISKGKTQEKLQYPVPLIYPFHVDNALVACEEVFCRRALSLKNKTQQEKELLKATHRAGMAKHMINCGFYGSLRESEFTGLKINNVIFDANGQVLCVRDSKSKNGKRNIPLFALAPDAYQKQFMTYYKERLSEASSGDEWLFPDFNGKRLDASSMARRIQTVFDQIGIINMVFHDLRHGFANFFLLRWFHAFYPEFFHKKLPILKYKLFQDPYINRLKELVIGENKKIGQENITHGLPALSILMGHAGPVITLQEYVHTIDWLFYLISRSLESREISYTAQQMTNFLYVSYPTLPTKLKGRGFKSIALCEVLACQQARLDELFRIQCSHMCPPKGL